jgi:hypothetical protein
LDEKIARFLRKQAVHIANPPTATSKTQNVFYNIIVDIETSQYTRIYKIGSFAHFARIEQNGFGFVLTDFCFRQKEFLLLRS